MKNIVIGMLGLAIIVAMIGCSSEADPKIRIKNEQSDKANVQIQTTGGNTININDVEAGQVTAYQTAAEGYITVVAVIQKESFSPTLSFYATKDSRYTLVVEAGNIPALRVDRE